MKQLQDLNPYSQVIIEQGNRPVYFTKFNHRTFSELLVDYLINKDLPLWPEAEALIKTNPKAVLTYAVLVLKERWIEGEPALYDGAYWVDWKALLEYYEVFFAKASKRNRWPEAEFKIKEDAELAYKYAIYSLKERWPDPEDEVAISKNPLYAYLYTTMIIDKRWPEGEKAISKGDPGKALSYYKKFIAPESWRDGEETFKKYPPSAIEYALLRKTRFHQAESEMVAYAEKFTLDRLKKYYKTFIFPAPWRELEDAMLQKRFEIAGLLDYVTWQPEFGVEFAISVLKDRWPALEKILYNHPDLWDVYTEEIDNLFKDQKVDPWDDPSYDSESEADPYFDPYHDSLG